MSRQQVRRRVILWDQPPHDLAHKIVDTQELPYGPIPYDIDVIEMTSWSGVCP